MTYIIVVFTMLNSSGTFPNPAINFGGKFSSLTECHSGLMNRMTDKHTMRKNENCKLVIYSNDGNHIWAESCVPIFN